MSGGTTIPLSYDPAGLSAELKASFPHLAGYAAFRLPADRLAEVPAALKGQLAVSAGRRRRHARSTPRPSRSRACSTISIAYDGPLGVTFAHGRADPAGLGAHGPLGEAPPLRDLERARAGRRCST